MLNSILKLKPGRIPEDMFSCDEAQRIDINYEYAEKKHIFIIKRRDVRIVKRKDFNN